VRRRLDALSDHFIICGFGRVGRAAAEDFAREDVLFAVVDRSEDLGADDIPHVVGDATDESTLRAAGIERAQALLCAVDSDSVNVYVALTARALNPRLTIVARASSLESVDVLRRAGADRVVSPFGLSGRLMASLSLRPSLVDFIDSFILAPGQRLEEIVVEPGSWLAGKALSEVGAAHPGVHVLAIRRADGDELVTSPPVGVALNPGDVAVVFGPVDALQALG
jgi:voltage-gated potassium channel